MVFLVMIPAYEPGDIWVQARSANSKDPVNIEMLPRSVFLSQDCQISDCVDKADWSVRLSTLHRFEYVYQR